MYEGESGRFGGRDWLGVLNIISLVLFVIYVLTFFLCFIDLVFMFKMIIGWGNR